MLVGSYPMSVDSKARVTLPAVFRKELTSDTSKTLYLVPMKESVHGYSPKGFEDFVNSIFPEKEDEPRDPKAAKLKRTLTSRAVSVDIDAGGRVALGKLDVNKPGTRERFGLTADVTVVGADDHFEVWNTQMWNDQCDATDSELDELLFG